MRKLLAALGARLGRMPLLHFARPEREPWEGRRRKPTTQARIHTDTASATRDIDGKLGANDRNSNNNVVAL